MTTTATEVACRMCGVATTENVTTVVVPDPLNRPTFTTEVGVCAACVSLRPDEPGSAVRAALRLLGKNEADDGLAAPVFIEAGLDVAPLLYSRGKPQAKAWGHVPKEYKADLRRAYVRVLDARVFAASADQDRPVPPHAPDPEFPQACLACGVGKSVDWHGPITTTALSRGPELVTGVVCDVCVPHLTAAGAVGAQFLERAVMRAKGFEWGQNVRLPRLKAWFALHRAEGLPPQAEPWSWVDLREPAPELDPIVALRVQIAELTERLAALEARS